MARLRFGDSVGEATFRLSQEPQPNFTCAHQRRTQGSTCCLPSHNASHLQGDLGTRLCQYLFSLYLSSRASSLSTSVFLYGKTKHNPCKPVLLRAPCMSVLCLSFLTTACWENGVHLGSPPASHLLVPDFPRSVLRPHNPPEMAVKVSSDLPRPLTDPTSLGRVDPPWPPARAAPSQGSQTHLLLPARRGPSCLPTLVLSCSSPVCAPCPSTLRWALGLHERKAAALGCSPSFLEPRTKNRNGQSLMTRLLGRPVGTAQGFRKEA